MWSRGFRRRKVDKRRFSVGRLLQVFSQMRKSAWSPNLRDVRAKQFPNQGLERFGYLDGYFEWF